MPNQVIIALGSNLHVGKRGPKENLQFAAQQIETALGATVRWSSFWESQAQDMNDEATRFINAVIEVETSLSPDILLETLQSIEVKMGRARVHGYHESRTIDLDIITYADCQISQANLVIPHPGARQRLFVLLPLAELRPELILPGQELTIVELIPLATAMQISCLP